MYGYYFPLFLGQLLTGLKAFAGLKEQIEILRQATSKT